jgi:hypothetical protein
MYKILATLVLCLLTVMRLSAIDVIARQSGGQTTYTYINAPYTGAMLQTAFNTAQNGDTLYLPSVTFTLSSNLYLNKGIVIVGAGADADSTIVTKFGANGGQFILQNGSSNAQFHGIDFDVNIMMAQNTTDQISGVKFIRCEIPFLQTGSTSVNNLVSDVVIRGCIVSRVSLYRASNVLIESSFLNYLNNGVNGTIVNNCVIGLLYGLSISDNSGVLYQNNIFLYNTSNIFQVSEASTFKNNAFIVANGGSVSFQSSVLSQQNNLYWQSPSDIFLNWSSTTDYSTYYPQYDLHVVNVQARTMGINGVEVGLYGSQYKWKDGMVPFNPHGILIQTGYSTSNSLLGLTVQATAQEPAISKITGIRYWRDQSAIPADLHVLNFTPSSRVINYNGFIDFCQSGYNSQFPLFFQLQDNLGNLSVVTVQNPFIGPTGTPGQVTITQVGNDLQSDAFFGNQWLLNGNPIQGATGQNYTPTQNGTYSTVVTNSCGSSMSNTIAFSMTGINEIEAGQFKLYPNPSDGVLTVQLDGVLIFETVLTITDALGQVVHSQSLTAQSTKLNLDVAAGLYIASLTQGGQTISQRITITH